MRLDDFIDVRERFLPGELIRGGTFGSTSFVLLNLYIYAIGVDVAAEAATGRRYPGRVILDWSFPRDGEPSRAIDIDAVGMGFDRPLQMPIHMAPGEVLRVHPNSVPVIIYALGKVAPV